MSVVTAFTPAACADAAAWFRHKLSFETDCADVYSAMRDGACVLYCCTSSAVRRPLPDGICLERCICRIA